jgi:hypothetical protein
VQSLARTHRGVGATAFDPELPHPSIESPSAPAATSKSANPSARNP